MSAPRNAPISWIQTKAWTHIIDTICPHIIFFRIDKYNPEYIGNIDRKNITTSTATERIFPARYIIWIYFSLFFTSVADVPRPVFWLLWLFSPHFLAFDLTSNMCIVHYICAVCAHKFRMKQKTRRYFFYGNIKVSILIIRWLPFHYFAFIFLKFIISFFKCDLIIITWIHDTFTSA